MSFSDSPNSGKDVSKRKDISKREGTITIDCDTCIMKDTSACEDCIVTYMCDRPVEHAVVVDLADFRAMKALAVAGLVPDLRHQDQKI